MITSKENYIVIDVCLQKSLFFTCKGYKLSVSNVCRKCDHLPYIRLLRYLHALFTYHVGSFFQNTVTWNIRLHLPPAVTNEREGPGIQCAGRRATNDDWQVKERFYTFRFSPGKEKGWMFITWSLSRSAVLIPSQWSQHFAWFSRRNNISFQMRSRKLRFGSPTAGYNLLP